MAIARYDLACMLMIICLGQILASLCNSVMDVIKYRWSRSIFAHYILKIAASRPAFARRFKKWWAPESWQNKHEYGSSRSLKRFLFTTVFVWLTNAWHFFKGGWYLAYQALVVYAALPRLPIISLYPILDFMLYVALLKLIHFIVFELSFNKILIS